MKKALILGITGQDGSYLSEILLEKGYEVNGVIRRSSSFNTGRIEHILKDLNLYYGDLTDSIGLREILTKVKPDEVYNLAAQSHVQVSFKQPVYTVQADAVGTINLLEAIRDIGLPIRFYQASSSEMFGKVQEIPQKESTPFYPRSPYACAKVYSHWQSVNYRESYGMHNSSGILFNHESVLKNSPIIIRKNNLINILPIEDLFRTEKHRYEGLLQEYIGSEVWNGSEWTKIISGTCYQDKNKKTKIIQTRDSSIETTEDHEIFMEDNSEVKAGHIKCGQKLFRVSWPNQTNNFINDIEFCRLLGFIAGDGYVSDSGDLQLTGVDEKELIKYASILENRFGWKYKLNKCISGYGSQITQCHINCDKNWGKWIRSNLYTKISNEKRIPQFILNGDKFVQEAFFKGYYDADGRKVGNENYEWKGFTSSSATLFLGLSFIIKNISSQIVKCKCEYRDGKRYYYAYLGNPSNKPHHRLRAKNEVIKLTEASSDDGWFFDLQTESQTFASGPNLSKIHNSPRRGETFVTRKITRAATRIKVGLQKELFLGNLDAKRDWGFAKDYCAAMHLMLQQDKPDDYVIATGETHSVKEFAEKVFKYLDLNWQEYVKIDQKYMRPAEVDLLIGDASKALKVLGWKPKTTFDELVKLMVDSDMEIALKEKKFCE